MLGYPKVWLLNRGTKTLPKKLFYMNHWQKHNDVFTIKCFIHSVNVEKLKYRIASMRDIWHF